MEEHAGGEMGVPPACGGVFRILAEMYAQHGFIRAGDDFIEDGVPHVPMLRPGGPKVPS